MFLLFQGLYVQVPNIRFVGVHPTEVLQFVPGNGPNLKRKVVFQTSFFRSYVEFQGCTFMAGQPTPM